MNTSKELINAIEDRVQQAVKFFLQHKGEKECTYRSVAAYFEVSSQTLFRRVNNKCEAVRGRPPALDKDLEDQLCLHLITLSKLGHGLEKREISDMLEYHLRSNRLLKKRYPNFKFGHHWLNGFFQRHPELSERIATNVEASRVLASDPVLIDNFFKIVNDCYQKHNITDGNNVFNCDESGVQFNGGNKCKDCDRELLIDLPDRNLWRTCEKCPNWFCGNCCAPEFETCRYC